jgi:hypothetical protein
MVRFQLPMLDPGMSLNRAFGELYERRLSAGVIARPKREFRLVTFDHMTEAMAHGAIKLEVVHGYGLPILGENFSDQQANDFVVNLGANVGLVRAFTKNANLFSTNDTFGDRFMSPSNVKRCDRPNKPRGSLNQDWYHYYPPFGLPSPVPHDCVAVRCDGTIR